MTIQLLLYIMLFTFGWTAGHMNTLGVPIWWSLLLVVQTLVIYVLAQFRGAEILRDTITKELRK